MTLTTFLAEWCFQALTERMTFTRLELWHRFQSASDLELARQIKPDSFGYTLEEIATVISDIRTANAGDLGEFALFALGLGNVPLRPSDLTAERRDTLIRLELIALGPSSVESSVKTLADAIQPNSIDNLRTLAQKYKGEYIASLQKKDSQTLGEGAKVKAIESKLPDLVVHTREAQEDHEYGRRMAQLSRLLSMP